MNLVVRELNPIQFENWMGFKTMTTNNVSQTKIELCCSFCGKDSQQVKFLIADPPIGEIGLYICDECVDTCNKIISAQRSNTKNN